MSNEDLATGDDDGEKVAPDWIGDFFIEQVADLRDNADLIHTAIDGIRSMGMLQQLIDNPTDEQRAMVAANPAGYAIAQHRARTARTEIDNGFARLLAQASVSLWSGLESIIVDLAAAILSNDKNARRLPAFEKLQVSVALYESMSAQERDLYLVGRLEEMEGAKLTMGVSRFESLLGKVGLPGIAVSRDIKDTLFELSQVRNVIVHHRARADRRIIENCPWLDLKSGDRVRVSDHRFDDYLTATVGYLTTIMDRLFIKYGIARADVAQSEEVREFPL